MSSKRRSNRTPKQTREQYVAGYVEQIMEDIQSNWLPGLGMTKAFSEQEIEVAAIEAVQQLSKALDELATEMRIDGGYTRDDEDVAVFGREEIEEQ